MKLSDQAMGTLMMTLQKCLMEQSDITGILKQLDFDFYLTLKKQFTLKYR